MSLKKLLKMFLIFLTMENGLGGRVRVRVNNKIHLKRILEHARTSLYVHCLSVNFVSENRCLNTEDRIQIMTIYK